VIVHGYFFGETWQSIPGCGWREHQVKPGGWWRRAMLTFLVRKPRIPSALLVLASAMFGATYVTPTGPLGAARFLGAAVCVELALRSKQATVSVSP